MVLDSAGQSSSRSGGALFQPLCSGWGPALKLPTSPLQASLKDFMRGLAKQGTCNTFSHLRNLDEFQVSCLCLSLFLLCYAMLCYPVLQACLLSLYLSDCLSVYRFTYLPACLPTCLPTYLPTCLPTYLPTYLPSGQFAH